MLRTNKNKRKWQELNGWQRAAIVLGGIIQVTLLGAALWDIRRRSADEIRGDKRLWSAVAFVNYVGPISYFLVGRKRITAS